MSQGKKQWQIGLIGLGAGVLITLTGNMLSDLTEKKIELNQSETDKAEEVENETGIKTAANVEISEKFAKKLILYQYIEYGLRKYSEDNDQNERYYCDIEEDLLSYDTEFTMENEGDVPYKTDLPKEIIPELANNIYNFRLKGPDDNIYMTIDTYNMKIYVYDQIK